jgi:hypothetical protein
MDRPNLYPYKRVKDLVNIEGLPTLLNTGLNPFITEDGEDLPEGLWVYEGLRYNAGEFLAGKSGGVGWQGAWFTGAAMPSGEPTINTGSLIPIADSLHLFIQGRSSVNSGTGTTTFARREIDVSAIPPEYITEINSVDQVWALGESVYMSYLFDTATLDGSWRIELRREDDTLAFSFGTDNPSTTAPNYFDYINPDTQTTVDVTTIPEILTDTVYLVVVEFNYTLGGDVTNVYINPTPEVQPVMPDFTYVSTSQSTRFNEFYAYALGSGKEINWDEIRMGASFASVTPHAPNLLQEDGCFLLTEDNIKLLI